VGLRALRALRIAAEGPRRRRNNNAPLISGHMFFSTANKTLRPAAAAATFAPPSPPLPHAAGPGSRACIYVIFFGYCVPPPPLRYTDILLRYDAETLLYEMRPSRTTTRPLRANVGCYTLCYCCVLHCNRRDHGRVCAVRVFTIWFSPMFVERSARGIRRPDLSRRE